MRTTCERESGSESGWAVASPPRLVISPETCWKIRCCRNNNLNPRLQNDAPHSSQCSLASAAMASPHGVKRMSAKRMSAKRMVYQYAHLDMRGV
jgi:hypothetical protein